MKVIMKNYFEVENVEVVERVSHKFKKLYIDCDKLIAVAREVIKWQLQLKVQ